MRKTVVICSVAQKVSFTTAQQKKDTIKKECTIKEVELFGECKKQPQDLDAITRLLLNTRDQIQSISVVSHKAIEQLGVLSVTDVAKNVPGLRVFFNNIFDAAGYSSYFRGGSIDQIQPRNFSAQINYKF